MGIPQCLAYAMMSGLPPAYGLATAAVPGFVAALAGKSPHIVTGPTNTTGLLILAALTPWLGADGFVTEAGLGALATLAILAGLLRSAAATAGGAGLIRFLPESVLAGFTAGAGLLIIVMQLDEALGLQPIADSGLVGELTGIGRQLAAGGLPAIPTMVLTAVTAVAITLGKRWAPRAPVALFAVLGGVALALVLGMDASSGLALISDRSAVPTTWPPGATPRLDPTLIRSLLVPAAAIALLGTLELAVSARADGAQPDMRREIVAQGLANIAGAFTSAFPASASLTRSALLRLGDARTRLAPALAAAFTVPILLFAGELVAAIPQASLAGVLLITAIRMINPARIRRLWNAAPVSRLLLLVTLLATLTLPLEWAVIVGAVLGLAIHLGRTCETRIRLLRPAGDGLAPIEGEEPVPECVVVEVSGDLYYAAVDHLLKRLMPLAGTGRTVVVDLSHAHHLRYAALQALELLSEKNRARGGRLVVAGVSSEFAALARRADSELSLTPESPSPGRSVRRCLDELGIAAGSGAS